MNFSLKIDVTQSKHIYTLISSQKEQKPWIYVDVIERKAFYKHELLSEDCLRIKHVLSRVCSCIIFCGFEKNVVILFPYMKFGTA
jgi:hypothetical protein